MTQTLSRGQDVHNTDNCPRCAYFQSRWKEERGRADDMQERLRFFEEVEVIPNDRLSAQNKAIARALYRIQRMREQQGLLQPGELMPMYRAEASRLVGCSDQTVSAGAKALYDGGVIDKQNKTLFNPKTQQYDKVLMVRMDQAFIEDPAAFDVKVLDREGQEKEGRNHGGKRVVCACKSCRSLKTNVEPIQGYKVTCRECGAVEILDENNPQDTPFILTEQEAETWYERYVELPSVKDTDPTLPAIVASPVTPSPEPAQPTPPALCLKCKGKDFHLALSNDRWLCLDCNAAYTLYEGRALRNDD